MPKSDFKARAVRKKTREVANYHHDTALPGKPLHMVIPGGLMALACLGTIIAVIHQTWLEHNWAEERGIGTLALLVPVYVGSVFFFSYGYELYDTDRAIKLTAWIVFLTLGIVVIVGVLVALASGSNNGSDSKSNSKSSKGSSKGSSDDSLLASLSSSSDSPNSRSGSSSFARPIIDLSFPTVINEAAPVAPAEPSPPESTLCTFCKAEYIPEQTEFTCPKCGAPSSHSESSAE
ncbi:MAG: hypothetical protein DWI21_16205 [Planctomycetota bacterium]|nr:MAG: hypothetical protein DWI21_16205 [Planctomycetota bacterium]